MNPVDRARQGIRQASHRDKRQGAKAVGLRNAVRHDNRFYAVVGVQSQQALASLLHAAIVRNSQIYLFEAVFLHQLPDDVENRAAGADLVIQDDGHPLSGKVADDLRNHRFIRARAMFRSDRAFEIESPAKVHHQVRGAGVGSDYDHVLPALEAPELFDEQRQRREHVDRHTPVEAANLPAVRVPGDEAVDACRSDQVGHQPGCSRLAAEFRRFVLTSVRQIGKHGRHMTGSVLSKSPGGDQETHVVLIHAALRLRVAEGLQKEDVATADVEIQADARFRIGELVVDILDVQGALFAFRLSQKLAVALHHPGRQIRTGAAAGDEQRPSRWFHPPDLIPSELFRSEESLFFRCELFLNHLFVLFVHRLPLSSDADIAKRLRLYVNSSPPSSIRR